MPKPAVTNKVDGLTRCARYALGPNRLHLCGPDASREVLAYLKEGVTDPGLEKLLRQFSTLYPYLLHIARANNIADPFDVRVVEAYWIGNELLENISLPVFYRHLVEALRLKVRQPKYFPAIEAKLPRGARMHHSFHVLSVYERTGHEQNLHTLESMDACRVSWGRVEKVEGAKIIVWRKSLKLEQDKLALGAEELYAVTRRLEDDFIEVPTPGQYITLHWGVPCEVVSEQNIRWLEKYTLRHIALANEKL